jgi:predicted dehydrogenase
MQQSEVSRRSFLKNAAVLSTVAGVFPTILTAQTGANKPVDVKQASANEKINLACVGCGNQGAGDIKQFAATGLINVVALCDVDLGAPHTTEIIEKFPEAKHFKDFRKMFDTMSNQIDAVSIGIPDFAHFAVAMTAIKLGKHVFVEKPLARTFYQNELLMQAAAKYKVVTQMGNQGHSEANYFQFKAWVDAGIIKDVTAITAHMNSSRRWHGWDPKITHFPAGEPLPATLDWDTWLNIAQYHDYNHDYHNGQWRCWFDFGLGALGDWGCHIIDTAHQFL